MITNLYHTLSVLNACLKATLQMLQRATANATGDLTSSLSTASTFDASV